MELTDEQIALCVQIAELALQGEGIEYFVGLGMDYAELEELEEALKGGGDED
jgi:hypothetical protein